ncbi:MAG TPA: nucleotide pyrophosphohydrolase [Thermoplasmata archaeon]|nr:nucleotide pyrophosphohydrolase [Thermoplasmata archaeon]
MADADVTVGQLRDRVRAFLRAREWERYHNPKDLAMALSIESAELLAEFFWMAPTDPAGLADDRREAIEDELADVVIYALHFPDAMGSDLSDAVLRKVSKNEARFPTAPDRSSPR